MESESCNPVDGAAENSENVVSNTVNQGLSFTMRSNMSEKVECQVNEMNLEAGVAALEDAEEVAIDSNVNEPIKRGVQLDKMGLEIEAEKHHEVEPAATDPHEDEANAPHLDDIETVDDADETIVDSVRETVTGKLYSTNDAPNLVEMGHEVENVTAESIEDLVRETVKDMLDAVVDILEMQEPGDHQQEELTEEQEELLEDLFQNYPNPDVDILEAVAVSMAITLEQAVLWFEQRRTEQRAVNQNEPPAPLENRGPAPNEFWQPHQQIGNENDETELTWYQVMMMKNLFEDTNTPDAELRAAVAASIGLSDTKVQAWFAHRRAISGISEPVQNNRTERVAIDRQYPQGVLEAFMELPEPDENYQIGQMADENQDKEFNEELKRRMSCEVCDTDNQKAFRCCKCMTGFCKKCHKGYLKYPTYVSPMDNRIICEFCHHPQKEFQKIVVPRM